MIRFPLSPDDRVHPAEPAIYRTDPASPVNGAFAWGVRLFLIGIALIALL